jgi:hypothetical protein
MTRSFECRRIIMKLNIKYARTYGSDRMTSQSEWHIAGNIDGSPVKIFYLDSGNNAEHDRKTELSVTTKNPKHEVALLDWIDRKGEDVFMEILKLGVSVSIGRPQQTTPNSKKSFGGPKRM